MFTWLRNKLKGWRTITANVLFSIIPIMQLTEFRDIVPSEYLGFYTLFVVLANMWLRKITTTPLGQKDA